MTANQLKHQAKVQEWKELVRECRSSGMPVEHWCKERGVSKHTYYRWEREILDIAAQHITSIAPKEGGTAGTSAVAKGFGTYRYTQHRNRQHRSVPGSRSGNAEDTGGAAETMLSDFIEFFCIVNLSHVA